MHRCLRPGVLAAALLLSAAAGAQALPGSLPLRRDAEAPGEGGPWMPSLVLLGIAVAGGGYALWRRGNGARAQASGARRAQAAVTRLSSQPLTPHASVHAVQWNGEEFLLACTSQQVTLLARRPLPGAGGEAP